MTATADPGLEGVPTELLEAAAKRTQELLARFPERLSAKLYAERQSTIRALERLKQELARRAA